MGEQNDLGEQSFEETLTARPDTIVIGLGNPILGDDGIGWCVAREVQARLESTHSQGDDPERTPIEFEYLSLGGLSLMERMIGYDKALLIDAISTGHHPIGEVFNIRLEDLTMNYPGHLASAHDTSLQAALEMGRAMDAQLPEKIMIIAIECNITYDFSEELTPPIEAAIPKAAEIAIHILHEYLSPGIMD
jgi:hydrogenase maturation protease